MAVPKSQAVAPGNFRDLSGQRFERLTVLQRHPVNGANWTARWVCRCDCANLVVVTGKNLKNGHTRSCGCLLADKNAELRRTHGMSDSPEHAIWASMKARCENPNSTGYQWYGARGIKVCESWRNDFAAFFRDVGPRPSKAHSIDRIDNDGDYEPGNVRWATKKEQVANRRRSRGKLNMDSAAAIRHLKRDNPRLTNDELAAEFGVGPTTIRDVLAGRRWT